MYRLLWLIELSLCELVFSIILLKIAGLQSGFLSLNSFFYILSTILYHEKGLQSYFLRCYCSRIFVNTGTHICKNNVTLCW